MHVCCERYKRKVSVPSRNFNCHNLAAMESPSFTFKGVTVSLVSDHTRKVSVLVDVAQE